jgi:tellurite resistance protein TehA-like permease
MTFAMTIYHSSTHGLAKTLKRLKSRHYLGLVVGMVIGIHG